MQTFLDSRHIAIEKSNEASFHQAVADSHNLTDKSSVLSD